MENKAYFCEVNDKPKNNMEMFVSLIIIVFGILQIILFFKLWEMTNNVRMLTEHFCAVSQSQDTEKENLDVIENDEYDPRLDTIKPRDKVEDAFDGKELIVDSINGNRFFCNTGVFSGYKYFKKSEVKYIEKG